MEKTYRPEQIESQWYQFWESGGYFSASGTGKPYCIVIPPPNVTGSLHMGHAFQQTLMDALIRYHRMLGDDTLWQAGTDHAGIATQMVVERLLARENKTRHDLGRDEFIARVWEWKEHSGGTITEQQRRLGASLDWSRERFTMDPDLSGAVLEVFIRLYEEGLIYRGKRLVNWDPQLHTAISDLEVVAEEEDGQLWHFRYPLSDGSGHVVVATTRPETMLGDTAVAVHPDDPRYRALIGRSVRLPLCERDIPVIADEYVDPEFGTGCVKITPAHDFNDYQVWLRHKDELSTQPFGGLVNVFTPDARIKASGFDDFTFGHRASGESGAVLADQDGLVGPETVQFIPAKYHGLDRFEARERIVEDMDTEGLIERIEPHRLKVPRGDRSGVVIEPYLTDQWFVAARSLAGPAVAAVENGNIEFVPKQWENTYFAWMRDLQDWCISRQLWWGHQIPAWYDDAGRVYVGRSEAEVREKHALGDIELTRDPDVLDTWFSSALWTFSTLGWPRDTRELRAYHPTSVLVTGFDIIFFWVARMIMMTLKFLGEVPFRQVYITGLIRDEHGQKMSKSKGNVIDPLDLIDGIGAEELVEKRTAGMMQPQLAKQIAKTTREEYPEGIAAHGTDALRFTLCSLASTGRDIKFDMGRLEGYRNFCNKLWNAARFVLMYTEGQTIDSDEMQPGLAEAWIVSRFNQTVEAVRRALDSYRFDLAAQALYEFTWNDYCDWYLELAKPVLNDSAANSAVKNATRRTLLDILEKLLRLAHPVVPFITEEIWQRVAPLAGRNGETIMTQNFPRAEPEVIDSQALADVNWLRQVIVAVRNIRGELNLGPARALAVLLVGDNEDDRRREALCHELLLSVGRLESIQWLEDKDAPPPSATQLVASLQILVPLAGLIDFGAEIARLEKEASKLQAECRRLSTKLDNPNFRDKAPALVVAKEQAKLSEASMSLETIRAKITELSSSLPDNTSVSAQNKR